MVKNPRIIQRPIVELPIAQGNKRWIEFVLAMPPQKLFDILQPPSSLAKPKPRFANPKEEEVDRWARQAWIEEAKIHPALKEGMKEVGTTSEALWGESDAAQRNRDEGLVPSNAESDDDDLDTDLGGKNRFVFTEETDEIEEGTEFTDFQEYDEETEGNNSSKNNDDEYKDMDEEEDEEEREDEDFDEHGQYKEKVWTQEDLDLEGVLSETLDKDKDLDPIDVAKLCEEIDMEDEDMKETPDTKKISKKKDENEKVKEKKNKKEQVSTRGSGKKNNARMEKMERKGFANNKKFKKEQDII